MEEVPGKPVGRSEFARRKLLLKSGSPFDCCFKLET